MDLAREKNSKDSLKSSVTRQLRQTNAAKQAQQNESTEDGQLAIEDGQLAVKDVQIAAEDVQLAAEDVQLAVKNVQHAAEDVQLAIEDGQLAVKDVQIAAEDVQLAVAVADASEGQPADEEDTPVIHLMNSPFSNDDTIKQELLQYQKYPKAGELR